MVCHGKQKLLYCTSILSLLLAIDLHEFVPVNFAVFINYFFRMMFTSRYLNS